MSEDARLTAIRVAQLMELRDKADPEEVAPFYDAGGPWDDDIRMLLDLVAARWHDESVSNDKRAAEHWGNALRLERELAEARQQLAALRHRWQLIETAPNDIEIEVLDEAEKSSYVTFVNLKPTRALGYRWWRFPLAASRAPQGETQPKESLKT